jgi:virulence-associated protein VapD
MQRPQMKLIYIASDGRSGSTLLESILNNDESTTSVGECYRFWKRFYEQDTLCSCSEKIGECLLWSEIHNILESNITNYNPIDIWDKIQHLLLYKNYSEIDKILKNKEWKNFRQTIILFYKSISRLTNKNTIIDSSKNISWLQTIKILNFSDIRIIHIERDLQYVSNSWKKDIYLPEYYNNKVSMPKKSTFESTKSWIKVKYLIKDIEKDNKYLFIKYEKFIYNYKEHLLSIDKFTGLNTPQNLKFHNSHSFAGNPMRSSTKDLVISNKKDSLSNLNMIEGILLPLINYFIKIIL